MVDMGITHRLIRQCQRPLDPFDSAGAHLSIQGRFLWSFFLQLQAPLVDIEPHEFRTSPFKNAGR